jgi:hypothetical protein
MSHGSQLNKQDYKKILVFYKQRIPKSRKTLRDKAESLLATKLCRCIKAVKGSEGRAIAACTKTIVNKKGFHRGQFTCKRPRKIKLSKSIKNKK